MATKKVVSHTHSFVVKGELVPPGEPIDLDAVEAKSKIERGICEEYNPKAKKAEPKGGSSGGDESSS